MMSIDCHLVNWQAVAVKTILICQKQLTLFGKGQLDKREFDSEGACPFACCRFIQEYHLFSLSILLIYSAI